MSEPERRLAAILSADAVGYSRLMAVDEAGTIRAITGAREVFARCSREHHGRIVDSPGDNILAEFRTALDAVSCAVDVQREFVAQNADLPEDRRMAFRIGIHLGDIASEGGRIYGTGVNVAARLESLAEPDGLCISAEVRGQVESKLALDWEDGGEQPVKNIPTPVRVFRVRLDGDSRATRPRDHGGWSRAKIAAASAGTLVLCAVSALWLSWPAPVGWVLDWTGFGSLPVNPELPDKPSIVVLPFNNLSGDKEQEYFADGITEDLTTDLSRNSQLFVIARNTAFTYKDKTFNVQDVGRELGVRYALEGSVRKVEGRVRVNAQLIDASNGMHLWSERYDRELEDIFALQDEIAESLLDAVGVKLSMEEYARARRKPPEDLNAYDAAMRGYFHFHDHTRAGVREARTWFTRAIELDPTYAAAHAGLSASYGAEYSMGWELDPEFLELSEFHMRRCLDLDPALLECQMNRVATAARNNDFEDGLRMARRLVELAPNTSTAHMFLGALLAGSGQPLAGLESLQRAIRLNPRGTWERGMLAFANLRAGRDAKAVDIFERIRASEPDALPARVVLANHYEGAGEHARAQRVVDEIRAVNPDLTVEDLTKFGPWSSFLGLESAATIQANLRKAGLPERSARSAGSR